MPTLEDIKQRQNIQLVDLPNEFIGTILSEEMKEDGRKKECLYWDIALDGGGSFTQKISRGFYTQLLKALQLLNATRTEAILNKRLKFQKMDLGVMQSNPRWFPVGYADDKKS